jgi:hypothetical protein
MSLSKLILIDKWNEIPLPLDRQIRNLPFGPA